LEKLLETEWGSSDRVLAAKLVMLFRGQDMRLPMSVGL
jgi:hypothetical protein